MTIRTLPTVYCGTTFRSRLEADWAATLDALRVPWQYEPEGFELSDDTWYAPDFWLPTARAWMEVKGSHRNRISKVEQFAAELFKPFCGLGDETPWANDPQLPLVIIASEPFRTIRGEMAQAVVTDGCDRHHHDYHDVGIGTCPHCHAATMNFWVGDVDDVPDWCRNCGLQSAKRFLFSLKFEPVSFVRVPRPFGRQR